MTSTYGILQLSNSDSDVSPKVTDSLGASADGQIFLSSNRDVFERNFQSQLVNKLGQEIISGVHQPGTRLPNEAAMLERFSVSRTVLREAYSVLTAKGLIVARPRVGTSVRPKSEWNMLDPNVLAWHLQAVPSESFIADLYVLREFVEPPAAAIAAEVRTSETIEKISAAYDDMERHKNGAGELIAADFRFHSAILEATGNHFIGALGGLIHTALLSTFKLSWQGAAGIKEDRLLQHRAVFEAIRDQNPELAKQRMTELLRDSMNDVREGLRQLNT